MVRRRGNIKNIPFGGWTLSSQYGYDVKHGDDLQHVKINNSKDMRLRISLGSNLKMVKGAE